MEKAESCVLCKDHCAARIPLFKNLDCRELIEVVKTVGSRAYKKGEVIFEEGSKCSSLYFINEGKVKLYKYTKDGKEQILSILGKNDFVGDVDFLKISEHKYNASAIENCRMCIITKDEMKTIMMNNPEIGIKVLEAVSEKMSAMENLIQNLATNDADSRVAYLLSELAEAYEQKNNDEIIINLSIGREDMANHIGITRETLSRKLKKFEDEKIIKLEGMKKIIILDLEFLNDYI